jgi:hypothetical protein
VAATPDGKGYWDVASDDGIVNDGDAVSWGSSRSMTPSSPIVGSSGPFQGQGLGLRRRYRRQLRAVSGTGPGLRRRYRADDVGDMNADLRQGTVERRVAEGEDAAVLADEPVAPLVSRRD